MNRKAIMIIIVAIAVLAALFLAFKWPTVQNKLFGTVCCTDQNPEAPGKLDETALLASLKDNWPSLEQGPLKHSGESGHWFMTEVQFISSSSLIVAYEDGLASELAVLSHEGGSFQVKKSFPTTGNVNADLVNSRLLYGDPDYSLKTYLYDNDKMTFSPVSTSPILNPVSPSSKIKIAWLDPSGTLPNEVKPGDISGCDHVVLQEREVPRTQAPLTAALKELLADKSNARPGGTLYNYLANGNMQLSAVSIENGLAKILLTGTPPPLAGVCDDPRLFVQVAQTARQFPSVQRVQLFVNDVENKGSGNGQGI